MLVLKARQRWAGESPLTWASSDRGTSCAMRAWRWSTTRRELQRGQAPGPGDGGVRQGSETSQRQHECELRAVDEQAAGGSAVVGLVPQATAGLRDEAIRGAAGCRVGQRPRRASCPMLSRAASAVALPIETTRASDGVSRTATVAVPARVRAKKPGRRPSQLYAPAPTFALPRDGVSTSWIVYSANPGST